MFKFSLAIFLVLSVGGCKSRDQGDDSLTKAAEPGQILRERPLTRSELPTTEGSPSGFRACFGDVRDARE